MGKLIVSRVSMRVFAGMALVLVWSGMADGQSVKASIVSTTLERTTAPQWIRELAYKKDQLHPLSADRAGCPLIEVSVSSVRLSLMLDSGTASGFMLTDHAPQVPHATLAQTEETNPDGTHRGNSSGIRVASMSVLGKDFENRAGTLSDWRMFSSEPFDGTVGLDFFLDRRLTLDYHAAKVATSPTLLPQKLAPARYVVLDLLDPPKSQRNILYARGRVNGHDAVVYLDTGYNISFIDARLAEGLPRVERTGRFRVFREQVPLQLGGHRFVLNDLREDTIQRGTTYDVPVGMVLGSDILSQFIVTIDLRARKLILAKGE